MAAANAKALVSTRKGLLALERKNSQWRIARTDFLGVPVTMALADPLTGSLYAALKHGHFGPKLHRSDDDGAHWIEVSSPAFPEGTDGAPALLQVWALESEPGSLWAGGMPSGLFRSKNKGESWEFIDSFWQLELRPRWFGGGNDAPGMHSVLLDPRATGKVTTAISCGGVWASEDDGESWIAGGRGLKATYMPPEKQEEPEAQDPHRVVRCAAYPDVMWMQHHCGVYRSTDSGKSWTQLHPPVSEFGFAVAAHPQDPNTAWFAPATSDENRVVKDGRVCVTVTHDGGKTWTVQSNGLPQTDAFELIYRHGLDVDSSGEQLLMGSTTGALWASDDGGANWSLVNAHLPPIYAVRFA